MNHILLFDGTWRSQKHDSNINTLRNITSGASASQSVFYDKGIGTGSIFDSIMGIFGFGLGKNICDGYNYLIKNYQPGDKIYLMGHSRGAFTARSLAGMLNNIGLINSTQYTNDAYKLYRRVGCNDDINKFKSRHKSIDVYIEFIGVFDTVGSLGVPYVNSLTKYHDFHNTDLCNNTKNGYHALSLDEYAPDFKLIKWTGRSNPTQQVEQQWFSGSHGDVGGGYKDDELSDHSLLWLLNKAIDHGVMINDTEYNKVINRLKPASKCILHDGYWDLWYGAYGVMRFGTTSYRLFNTGFNESVSDSVYERINNTDYEPKAIDFT